jgi:very-short-patch-repair endonuclease
MTLSDKLSLWQADLIDMSRLNRLLYFSSSTRSTSIQFLADAEQLFKQILTGRRPVIVDPKETPLEWDDCLRRLTRLRSRAREALNDRGTHVLFLAFGMLEWKEASAANETIRSPLILVPVSLAREGMLGRFLLSRAPDEEISVNPTLTEKLRQDFQIALPSYSTLESGDDAGLLPETAPARQPTLAQLLDVLAARLPNALGWRVIPEAHLGIFSFQKLVMYQDLARHRTEALAHPLLQVLGGERPAIARSEGLIGAEALDAQVRPHDVLEILDADSSQQEAIQAARAGVSFVLQGPPGTGKSQTIANIIAECLGQHKRVLFVSEKMAALEVVQQRLRDAGLGEFLLDLHSHKADKKELLQELKRAVEEVVDRKRGNASAAAWQHESDALLEARQHLNAYVRELHLPRAPLGQSIFQAYGVLARLQDVPNLDIALAGVEQRTRSELEQMKQALEQLLACGDVLDAHDSYPWRETVLEEFSLVAQASITHHFERLETEAATLESHGGTLRDTLAEPDAELTFGWLAQALERAAHVVTTPRPPAHWMEPGELERIHELAQQAQRQAAQHREGRSRFDPFYLPSARELEADALLSRLTEGASWLMSCLRADIGIPQDICITRRDELDRLLRAADALLPQLTETARALAAACQRPEPATLQDCAALVELSGCLLDTPSPPAGWLDPNAFAEVRAIALDAEERYTACARRRQALDALYTPALFELDLTGLLARFKEQYASPLRYLKPAFYQDSRQLRAVLRPGVARTPEQIHADLAQASALQAAEAWLREHRVEHARVLGRFFAGDATDWVHLRAALDWTARFHTLFAVAELTPELTRLVTRPAHAQASLRAQYERLQALWSEWQSIASFLGRVLKPQALATGGLPLEHAPFDALAAALRELHSALATYWSAVDTVAPHIRQGTSQPTGQPSWAALCTCLRLVRELNEIERWFGEREDGLARDFGRFYAGLDTEWEPVYPAMSWTRALLALYGTQPVPEALRLTIAGLGDPAGLPRLAEAIHGARQAASAIEAELSYSDTVLRRQALQAPGKTQEATALAVLRERVRFHLDNLPCLERWLDYTHQRQRCEALGLGDLLRAALGQRPFPRELVAMFEKRFYQHWLDAVLRQVPALERFRGEAHERVVSHFRELDGSHQRHARRRLVTRLLDWRTVTIDSDDNLTRSFEILRREVNKKRHRSIRQIVQATAPAMLLVKPCWMMSPLSVSQYVESAQPLFDVVIFDEASQVCPEDAICAILRGQQLIVVGDSRQLPPTRFFTKTLADDLGDDEEGIEDERTESILDECVAAGFLQRQLRWHYRSRHESLIAFSNTHFYNGRLVTFPSPHATHQAGVHFELVDDGIYDRGGTRKNVREAERVVDLIVEHLRRRSGISLGVVALSEAQQNAIREALERRRKQNDELAAYEEQLDEDASGGMFIKNLESVQGDERDVIILSIGYGKDRDGRLTQNFGPVNRTGGERRLNVAVTRARDQLIVVTSLSAGDLNGELRAPGAQALRNYLEYAERGPDVLARQTVAGDAGGGPARELFDSPFEEAVYAALHAKGLVLDTQVGCSGYRIDLAVRDPHQPGRYLLGIECDGASYHSSHTARDRDRLRQQRLEDMGWRIHRIWSRDWVRDPGSEVNRVLLALDEVKATRPAETTTMPEAVPVHADISRQGRAADPAVSLAEPVEPRPATRSSLAEWRRRPLPGAPSTRICETCTYFQKRTASRFRCGRDGTMRERDPGGATPACIGWKRAPSGKS